MAADKSLKHVISYRAGRVFKAAVRTPISSYEAGTEMARAQLLVGGAEAAQLARVDVLFTGKDYFLVGIQNQK